MVVVPKLSEKRTYLEKTVILYPRERIELINAASMSQREISLSHVKYKFLERKEVANRRRLHCL